MISWRSFPARAIESDKLNLGEINHAGEETGFRHDRLQPRFETPLSGPEHQPLFDILSVSPHTCDNVRSFEQRAPIPGSTLSGASMNRILPALLLAAACQSAFAFPTYLTGGFRGSELMSSDEVKDHVGRLLSMKTFAECQAYMDTHEASLQQRAQEKHITLPEKSGNPCAVMRTLGRVR
jgi:hypothetical protein